MSLLHNIDAFYGLTVMDLYSGAADFTENTADGGTDKPKETITIERRLKSSMNLERENNSTGPKCSPRASIVSDSNKKNDGQHNKQRRHSSCGSLGLKDRVQKTRKSSKHERKLSSEVSQSVKSDIQILCGFEMTRAKKGSFIQRTRALDKTGSDFY